LSEHPTSEDIAAYLNGALAPTGRAVLEEHLAACVECRHEVTTARRLLRQHRYPKRRLWLIPAAAAAVVAAVMLVRAPRPAPLGRQPLRSLQSGAADTVATISVLTPADGETVPARPVIFAWRGQPDRPLYRLSLTEASGREVWSAETTDTTLTLPATVSLERGRSYFWIVDALGADGRSLTTKTHRFVTRP
jgi:anti-sigma factor RsiW